ncbi:MAG: 50S ribosomal protein L23 [Methylacidiphilales bacterium]|nr:50S ribosomal protein L23 [Candidatus Methylacidiphilales bacterium]MDW8348987.1 50S ribosomal protein L23 [Verrucomicrobiae bacterium]
MRDPYEIIRRPRITEKGTAAAKASNSYVFEVDRSANKLEIKKAIKALFNKDVERVNIVVVKGKTKRTRNGLIRQTPKFKKAYVKLKEGQTIEFI